jgi:TonB family protein
MMSLIALLVAASGSAPPDPPPPPPPARPAKVVHLFSIDDYPPEALRNGEQGTVGVRLDIDSTGRVSGCTVTQSAGSAILDSATCRLLTSRARFTPATDAHGRPVPDVITTKITWRLDEEVKNPELDRATRTWMSCLVDAARPLVRRSLTSAAIADRTFGKCRSDERRVLAVAAKVPGSGPTRSADARRGIRTALISSIDALRR